MLLDTEKKPFRTFSIVISMIVICLVFFSGCTYTSNYFPSQNAASSNGIIASPTQNENSNTKIISGNGFTYSLKVISNSVVSSKMNSYSSGRVTVYNVHTVLELQNLGSTVITEGSYGYCELVDWAGGHNFGMSSIVGGTPQLYPQESSTFYIDFTNIPEKNYMELQKGASVQILIVTNAPSGVSMNTVSFPITLN